MVRPDADVAAKRLAATVHRKHNPELPGLQEEHMGLLKNKTAAAKVEDFSLPDGWHPATISKVTIGEAETGTLPVYTLTFTTQPTDDAAAQGANPIQYPRIEMALDTNDDEQADVLYGVLGTPATVKGGAVEWHGGILSYNGKAGEESRTAGLVEVLTKLVRPATVGKAGQRGWPARYEIKDIQLAGTAAAEAAQAAAALAAKVAAKSAPKGKGK